MVGNLLLRGMLVGIVAGILVFGLARVFGEPAVDHAIAFEEQMSKAAGEAPEPEIVSRETQAGIGLLTGVVVFSAAMGGLFSLVFAGVYGRIGRLGARSTAALLALGAYIAIVVVPDIKYPANPPAVGNPDTIGTRTALFFVMMAISIAALVVAVRIARGLAARHGGWNAALIGGAFYIVAIIIAQALLPTINEVPEQFSAVVLWQFRIVSLGIHALLWTTIGLVFGYLAEQTIEGGSRARLVARRA